MKKLLIFIFALVIFVAGCTIIPEPEKPKESLAFPTFSFETLETVTVDFSKLTTATTTEAPNRQEMMVWIPQTGEKYHSSSLCSGMKNPSCVTISNARRYGYRPCSKCCN